MSNELLLLIIPGLAGLFIFLMRAASGRSQQVFDDTLVRNQKLFDTALATVADLTTKSLALSVDNARLTALDTVSQRDITNLQRQISKQDERFTEQASTLTSLRSSSDAERMTSITQIAAYQKEIANRDETIKSLRDSTDATIKALQNRIDDLEKTVKALIGERDKLQDDKTERVRQSAHGADKATVERMMSDSKAKIVQESDSDDEPPDKAA